jgi:hypothetical protein
VIDISNRKKVVEYRRCTKSNKNFFNNGHSFLLSLEFRLLLFINFMSFSSALHCCL